MATEAKKEDKPADAAAPKEAVAAVSGGGKKKLIIIIALALVVIGAGAGAAFFLMGGKKTEEVAKDAAAEQKPTDGDPDAAVEAKPEEKKEETASADKPAEGDAKKEETSSSGANAEFGDTFVFKTFQLNLGNPLENHFMRMEVTAEFKGGKDQKAELEKRTPQLRDAIINIASRKSKEFLLGPDGKDQLRHEILVRINQYMSRPVESVYITDMLIE
jgi:flagellar FliL protein